MTKQSQRAWIGLIMGVLVGMWVGMNISERIIQDMSELQAIGSGFVMAGICGLMLYIVFYYIPFKYYQWHNKDGMQVGVAFAISTLLIYTGFMFDTIEAWSYQQAGKYGLVYFVAGCLFHWVVLSVNKFFRKTEDKKQS